MMHPVRFSLTLVLGTVLIPLATASRAASQEHETGHCPGKLEAINSSYVAQIRDVEQRWIADLARLTEDSTDCYTDAAYRQVFQLAIARDLCLEAQPAAQRYLSLTRAGKAHGEARSCLSSVPTGQDLRVLAATVQIFARAEKGEYEQSLADFESLCRTPVCCTRIAAEENVVKALTVGEAYLERLIRGGRYDIGLNLCERACKDDAPPVLKSYFKSRIARLALIGKAAPTISGTDTDGHQVSLADLKGKVVLVRYRQSQCDPCAAATTAGNPLAQKYHHQGFVVLEVNVDKECSGSRDAKTVATGAGLLPTGQRGPAINLVNRGLMGNDLTLSGGDPAPANLLIGREGKIVAIDLSGAALECAILRATECLTNSDCRWSFSRSQ
jgi:hypothetical protein